MKKLGVAGHDLHDGNLDAQNVPAHTALAQLAGKIDWDFIDGCAMRGWTAINIRMDPMATQVAQQPSSYEKIRDALIP